MKGSENVTATANHIGTAVTQERPAEPPLAKLVEWLDPPSDHNFEHYRLRHLAAELLRTLRGDGVLPGDEAPDFDLETTDGGRLRLSDLRGRPVLMHFVSYT
jgi:hypothetical protein